MDRYRALVLGGLLTTIFILAIGLAQAAVPNFLVANTSTTTTFATASPLQQPTNSPTPPTATPTLTLTPSPSTSPPSLTSAFDIFLKVSAIMLPITFIGVPLVLDWLSKLGIMTLAMVRMLIAVFILSLIELAAFTVALAVLLDQGGWSPVGVTMLLAIIPMIMFTYLYFGPLTKLVLESMIFRMLEPQLSDTLDKAGGKNTLVDVYLTTGEAAERLGVSSKRIRSLIHAGRLPAHKAGRYWKIRESDLDRVGEE